MDVALDLLELLGLDFATGLAGREGTLLHAILELDRFGVGPSDVVTEAIPVRFKVSIDVVWQLVFCYFLLNERVNLVLFSSS